MSVAGAYSQAWFDSFAATVPPAAAEIELAGILAVLPLPEHRTVLDIGCGIGRLAVPLSRHGYDVVGIDVSVPALRQARSRASGPRYIALDQRHISSLRTEFDAALVLWNSLGFEGRHADHETLCGIATVIRRGGTLVLDLYNPSWLELNQRKAERHSSGAVVTRWISDGRSFHQISYPDGTIDRIAFNVYSPEEMKELCDGAGFRSLRELVWWKTARVTTADARYQLVLTRGD